MLSIKLPNKYKMHHKIIYVITTEKQTLELALVSVCLYFLMLWCIGGRQNSKSSPAFLPLYPYPTLNQVLMGRILQLYLRFQTVDLWVDRKIIWMGLKKSHGVDILEFRDQRWRKTENPSAGKVWCAIAPSGWRRPCGNTCGQPSETESGQRGTEDISPTAAGIKFYQKLNECSSRFIATASRRELSPGRPRALCTFWDSEQKTQQLCTCTSHLCTVS